MKEKVILVFILVCLSIFGFRSILPEIPSSALVGLFTIAGLIGCYYHLRSSKNKRRIGM
jgi:D-alanyl-lipoteichoic acid acyltransferase DltB (MBOAT superfamily)